MRTSTSAIVASVLVCGIAVLACAKADDTGVVTDTPKTEPTPDAGAKKKDGGSTASPTKPGTSTSSSSGGGSSSGGSSGTSSSGSSGSGNGMCISSADFNSCV